MRILQLAHGVYPYGRGGVEIYTDALSRELLRRGHEVVVAAPISPGVQSIQQLDIPFRQLPWVARGNGGFDASSKVRKLLWSATLQIIHEFNPDVIHVQHLIHMGWGTLSELDKLGVPFLVSLHDYWYLCRGIQRTCEGSVFQCAQQCAPMRFARLLWPLYGCQGYARRQRCLRQLNRIAAPLVANSHRTADVYRRSGVELKRLVVQKLGIDPSGIGPVLSRPRTGPLVFGYLGDVSEAKGVDVLVRAFQRLPIGAALHVFGSGQQEFIQRVQELAVGVTVYFHGAYDHAEISNVLSKVDVVVIPSIWEETYCLVAQEALAARKIVIASAVGGLRDRIVHGINGFFVPPGDPGALARQMSFVAENYKELVQTLQYDLAQQDIGIDGERFENLYQWTVQNWDGLRQRTVEAVEWSWEELLNQLSTFLGEEPCNVRKKLRREFRSPGSTVQEAWTQARPVSDAEIEEFYRSTDCYLYDLLIVHRSSERRRWREVATALFLKYRVRTLLDYGGGCGDDSLYFSRIGLECTVYDYGRLTLGFARFRAEHVGAKIKFLDQVGNDRNDQKYDAVYCTEMLEHVVEPFREIERMRQSLVLGGVLVVTHSFDSVGNEYPSHLERHRGLSHRFVKNVEQMGFECLEVLAIPGNQFFVFQHVPAPRV